MNLDVKPNYCLSQVFYRKPSRGTLKFEDGEVVTYTCTNPIYRFKDDDQKDKTQWSRTLDVKCGWEKQWDPPILPPCVDPRGCPLPPSRNDRIWGSYEDDPIKSIDVGAVYW